jgi:hypothetical protein
VSPHLASPLIGGTPCEELEDRAGDNSECRRWDVERSQGTELGDFFLQGLNAGGRWVSFQVIEHRVGVVSAHDEQRIESGPHRVSQTRGDLMIERVEKAMQGGPDHPLEFAFGGEFNPQGAQMAIGTFVEVGLGGGMGRRLRLQPGGQRLSILGSGKAPPGMLPNEREMPITRAALPGIGGCMVPQQVQLMGNKGPDGGGHLLEVLWKIPQVLHGLEQDGHAMAIGLPMTRLHKGMLRGA